MKKTINFLMGILIFCAFVLPFSGCNNKMTGEAYGLVHNAGYIGKATITKSGDKIYDVTLEEMCLPTQIKASTDVAADDRVTVTTGEGENAKTTYYYKTVKYDDITMTYDAANGYMVGEKKLVDFFKNEENCKAYFEAAKSNKIKVMVGGEERNDIMTNAGLNKDENGYWTKRDTGDKEYSRWKVNRDATVKYVKENGVEGLKKMTQSAESVKDEYGVDSKYWIDSSGINTGATWTDMYKAENPSDYLTYSQLLIRADEKTQA